jgi:hypothetical protein
VWGGVQAGPSLRYTERGEKTSWNFQSLVGGSETVLERTLSSGLSVRWDVEPRVFLRANPELSYLVSGRAQGVAWTVGEMPRPYGVRYEKVSDRWNAIADVGVGTGWNLGGRPGTLEVRYMTEVNAMTRNVELYLSPSQRNIAWAGPTPIPYYSSEYRSHAVELVMGYSW